MVAYGARRCASQRRCILSLVMGAWAVSEWLLIKPILFRSPEELSKVAWLRTAHLRDVLDHAHDIRHSDHMQLLVAIEALKGLATGDSYGRTP